VNRNVLGKMCILADAFKPNSTFTTTLNLKTNDVKKILAVVRLGRVLFQLIQAGYCFAVVFQ